MDGKVTIYDVVVSAGGRSAILGGGGGSVFWIEVKVAVLCAR